MPNMTLLSYDVTEVWAWDTGNPMAFGGTQQWFQAPDLSTGGFRPSSMGGQVHADDFVCTAATPAMVDGLRWWGTYAGEPWTHRPNTPYLLPFMIQWYASDGAPHPTSLPLPGPPLMMHLVQANCFFVDYAPTGDAIYEFNARLTPAFVPPGPGEYFVSIADLADPAWQWMNATSTYLDTPAWILGSPPAPWTQSVFPDLAFVLLTAIPLDGDRDGDVDANDVSLFAACVSGPTVPFGPGCATYDFDRDQDVDQADFAVLQRCYSGSDRPADVNCVAAGPRLAGTWRSDCKPGDPTTDGGYPWCGKDELDVVVRGRSLLVTHRNATYNCCLDGIGVALDIAGRNLRFSETENLSAPCDCLCCYDVTTAVQGLTPGVYTIEYCWEHEDSGPTCLTKDVTLLP